MRQYCSEVLEPVRAPEFNQYMGHDTSRLLRLPCPFTRRHTLYSGVAYLSSLLEMETETAFLPQLPFITDFHIMQALSSLGLAIHIHMLPCDGFYRPNRLMISSLGGHFRVWVSELASYWETVGSLVQSAGLCAIPRQLGT